MERDLAAAIGQRDHLMNRNAELQREVDAAKAKLADIESMQCTQCAMVDSLKADLAAANAKRAEVMKWAKEFLGSSYENDGVIDAAMHYAVQVREDLRASCGEVSGLRSERGALQAAIARVKAWKQHTSVSMISGEMVHHDCQCIECKTIRRVVAELEAV
jgi:hypothetical protein